MAFITLQQMYDTWKKVADWVSGSSADKPVVTVDNMPSGLATAAKQDEQTALLESISEVDFATDASLAAILSKLGDIETDIEAVKTELTAIKSTDGIKKIEDTVPVQLTGSNMEYYGATVDDRPAANSVPVGAVYMAVQTQEVWQSDGTNWVVVA